MKLISNLKFWWLELDNDILLIFYLSECGILLMSNLIFKDIWEMISCL